MPSRHGREPGAYGCLQLIISGLMILTGGIIFLILIAALLGGTSELLTCVTKGEC